MNKSAILSTYVRPLFALNRSWYKKNKTRKRSFTFPLQVKSATCCLKSRHRERVIIIIVTTSADILQLQTLAHCSHLVRFNNRSSIWEHFKSSCVSKALVAFWALINYTLLKPNLFLEHSLLIDLLENYCHG